ncbi:PAS domain S-box protein [Alkalihalobacillus sp. BA299]|uniref:PAS domain S-box protein n=1 Tax=Alkalihalobacillus sp. BA299 TaxID=2815938 RepID=UPI001ADB4515|nr:PAS domain S-box protein [Alkalihalobacillus sp. BA299]
MNHLEVVHHNIKYICSQSPIPMIALSKDGIIVYSNEVINSLIHKDESLIGASFFDIVDDNYQDYLYNSLKYLRQSIDSTTLMLELMTVHKHWLKLHCRLFSDKNDTYFLISVEDITKQIQRDSLLKLNQELLNMIVKPKSIHKVLHRISKMVEDHFVREAYCSIFLLDNNNRTKNIIAPSLPKEYYQRYYGVEITEKGSCGAAMYRKELVIVSDISTDRLWEDLAEHTLSFGLRSCWSIPILIDNKVVGSFAIYHPYPSTPTTLELEMIETCANLIGLAIERRNTENRLIRETEERFKFVMDLIPDLIVFKDDQGRWIEGNQTAREKISYFKDNHFNETDPIYQQYNDFLFQVDETDQLALQFGTPIRRELILPQLNGEEEVFDIIKVPFSDDHILPKGLVVIGREITERKKTEQLLERNEQKFKSLFDHNPNGICIMGLTGKVTSCNRALEKLLGYSFSELAQKCHQFVAPEDIDRVRNYFEKSLNGDSQSYEINVKHKTGNKVYLKVTNVPIIVQGSVIGVYGIIEDITEKTKSEEKLKQTKEFLESLIHNSADCIGTFSLEGKLLHVNPAIENIYGWKIEEIVDKKFPVLPEELTEEMKQIISEIKEGKDIIGLETKRQKKDGTLIDVSITYSPLQDETGQVIGFISVSRDISDRKRTDELLKRSDKLSVIGQLSAAVAHEIRNPLTSIKGFIQLFRDRIEKEYTDLMLSELERIEVIVTEFLSLAKPQANYFLEKDPTLILKNTLAIIETEALLNQIEIKSTIDENTPSIFCNEHKIKQVLINVLKNAIEAMPNGGTLQIKMKNENPYVIIEISDQGYGIPKNKIQKLGEPFYSSKEHGTGLGLMVCFKIIEEHKGTITIDSEEGAGTTVSIRLPV